MKDTGNSKNSVIFDHHIARKSKIGIALTNLLDLILVDAKIVKITAQDYFENILESSEFNWKIFFIVKSFFKIQYVEK